MFEITFKNYFEDIQNNIHKYPEIEIWGNLPEELTTDVRNVDGVFWLSNNIFGSICVNCDSLAIHTYPKKAIEISKFNNFVIHNWLPLAYQVCGTQVIHGSAVVNINTNKVLVISGDSGSGKSTIAFGLASRKDWVQIADDRLAFSTTDESIKPVFIPDNIKLRSASANYFGKIAVTNKSFKWIEGEVEINNVFFLEQLTDFNPKTNFHIHPVNRSDSYELLLEQAFALSPNLKKQNQQMVIEYLRLANKVQSFKLTYPQNFALVSDICDAIEKTIL